MAWNDEAILLLRGAIGDFTPPYAYCDERVFDIFMFGARLVVQEITFDPQYTVDLNSSTITPTPNTDDPLLVLASLKASYIIANSEYKAKANGALMIVDGPSTISLSGVVNAYKERVKQMEKDYRQARLQYMLGNALGCQIITTPTTTSSSNQTMNYNVYSYIDFRRTPY